MNTFIQHIPAFCDGIEKQRFNFNTLDELLDHPVVKRWRMHPFDETIPSPPDYFHKYSLSHNRLMAEIKYGKEWYVIGHIKYPDELDLPKWERPE